VTGRYEDDRQIRITARVYLKTTASIKLKFLLKNKRYRKREIGFAARRILIKLVKRSREA
jgi:hypothetical protein